MQEDNDLTNEIIKFRKELLKDTPLHEGTLKDEIDADIKAIKVFIGLGYSKKQAFNAFKKIFKK